jgi:hypothetical protein
MSPDIRRLLLVGIPMVGLAGLILFITVAVPQILAAIPHAPPSEPIYFDHSVHTHAAGIDCQFCHRTVSTAGTAGFPEVQQCMFCHQVIASAQVQPRTGTVSEASAEIAKLRQYWTEQRPIDWERVHRMPDHVRFMHEPHISAGVQCATCHGDVQSMGQVVQVRPLGMGDCVSCHRANSAPTECATCHK